MTQTIEKRLKDKEFSLLQEIASRPDQTQRQLSRQTGLSLGMTNLLLMRLVQKGYVKIRHLDWKRTQYLLTMQGAMEKARKTYAYTIHTISLFRRIMSNVQSVVRTEYARGRRNLIVVAWPDTAAAIEGAVRELDLAGLRIEYLENFGKLEDRTGTILLATEEPAPPPKPNQRFLPLLDVGHLKFRFPDIAA